MHNKRMRPSGGPLAATSAAPLAATLAVALLVALPQMAVAQTNQLRGMPDSASPRLPSAEQQLQQNLNRQQQGFSFQQRIEGANRLIWTDQINRQNMQPDTTPNPCEGKKAKCREKNKD